MLAFVIVEELFWIMEPCFWNGRSSACSLMTLEEGAAFFEISLPEGRLGGMFLREVFGEGSLIVFLF